MVLNNPNGRERSTLEGCSLLSAVLNWDAVGTAWGRLVGCITPRFIDFYPHDAVPVSPASRADRINEGYDR